jgi:VanZ family protein
VIQAVEPTLHNPWPLRQRTVALPLLAVWVLLIVYASLYPFEGWRVPVGVSWSAWLVLPWPVWRDRWDEVFNLVGYMPLGILVTVAALRAGLPLRRALWVALGLALALSYVVELVQSLLPMRVPSLKDLALNGLGAGLGATVVAAAHGSDVTRRLRQAQVRWFGRRNGVGLALLWLWPVALVFPHPVPLGLGHGVKPLLASIGDTLVGSVLEPYWPHAWLLEPLAAPRVADLDPAIVALGVMAPCLLAYALTIDIRHRMALFALVVVAGVALTSLPVVANLGVERGLSWLSADVMFGLVAGCLFAAFATALPARAAAWLGVSVLVAMVWLVAKSPVDPYYVDLLKRWEQGEFMRFHGLTQWLGLLWPFATMGWLAARALRQRRPLKPATPAGHASEPGGRAT